MEIIKSEADTCYEEQNMKFAEESTSEVESSPPGSIDSKVWSTINELNDTFKEYIRINSDLAIDKLNSCLVLLASSMNPADVNLDRPEIVTLFINVHQLMNRADPRSASLWSSVALLEQAAQNSKAKSLLVHKFKFIPILGKLLESVSNQDRLLQVLRLVENISYGICITWQEPYLSELIKSLVNFVKAPNENLKITALSVLINLCYKNLPPTYTLLRTVPIEQFLNDIQPIGILACKMSFLLESSLENVSNADIHNFIGFTFKEVQRSLDNFNPSLLRHTVNFFLDMKSTESITEHFKTYPKYEQDVTELLEAVKLRTKQSEMEMAIDVTVDWPACIGNLFDFLEDLIKFAGQQMQLVLPDIVNCTIEWINSNKAGTQSLRLLTTIVQLYDDLKFTNSVLEEIAFNITTTLDVLQSVKASQEQIDALLKLISELLKFGPPKKDLCEAMQSFLFDAVFPEFLATTDRKAVAAVIESKVSTYVQGLTILMQMGEHYSAHDGEPWRGTLKHLLRMPNIQLFIAKAILSEDSGICSLVFALAKEESFPAREISEKISRHSSLLMSLGGERGSSCAPTYSVKDGTNNFVNVALEKRLDDLITKMMEAHSNKEMANILVSDVMDLFELKITMFASKERDLLTKLDECYNEVTSLSQKVTLLSAEVSQYQNEALFSQMTAIRLKAQLAASQKEKDRLLKMGDNYERRIDESKTNQDQLIIEIEMKESTITELNQTISELVSKAAKQQEEISELLESLSIEEMDKAKLNEMISDFNQLNTEMQQQITEKEDYIAELNKEVEDLANENSMLNECLNETKSLLAEKETLLENYAKDLRDVEEMRTQVVSIIQRKNGPPKSI